LLVVTLSDASTIDSFSKTIDSFEIFCTIDTIDSIFYYYR